jgi:hypothetical protein
MKFPIIQIAASAALAAGAFTLALVALIALGAGHGRAGIGDAQLSLAAGYDRQAVGLIVRPGRTTANLLQADQANRQAYRLYPYNTGALMRMAQVQAIKDGKLNQQSIAKIRLSYDLVAMDPSIGFWRIQFCVNHWAEMPADLKASVSNEYETFSKEPSHKGPLMQTLQYVDSPAGRLVAAFWIATLRR